MTDFSRALKDSYQQVNAALERYLCIFPDQQTPLIRAMRYGMLLGGKRLRPFLVYQIGRLFGLDPVSLDAPAAAVECIHAYSLIHDDLPAMDNDILRRGFPACHVKFGEAMAILAGDALQTLAFSILANADLPDVSCQDRLKMVSVLAAASGANGMCLGQALDLTKEGQKMSTTFLETIHNHKTADLIRASVHMGVLASGKCEESILNYHLDRYATTIGLAFQVHDDILDAINNKQNNEKQTRRDKKLEEKTYPALLGLDKTKIIAQNLFQESLASLESISALGYNTTTLISLARYIVERDK